MEIHTLSRTYRHHGDNRAATRRTRRPGREATSFRCSHCKAMVGPIPYGGKHRNHCPYCLYSRHVDGRVSGDRASDCGGSMAPTGTFVRPKGEHVLVHHCLACGFERYNRIAADDDFDLVLSLPPVEGVPEREATQPLREEPAA
jgi:hypothetical protein